MRGCQPAFDAKMNQLNRKQTSQDTQNKAAERRVDCGGSQPQPPAAHAAEHGAPSSNTAPSNCNDGTNTRILRVGVDSLYLSYPGELSQESAVRLNTLKDLAQSKDPEQQKRAQLP